MATWRLPLLLLLTFAGAEALVRFAEPQHHWVSGASNDYAQAVWRMEKTREEIGLAPDEPWPRPVLILGNSSAREGIDQKALSLKLGRPALNFGLSAEGIGGVADMTIAPASDGLALLCVNGMYLEEREKVDWRYPWWRKPWESRFYIHRKELQSGLTARVRRLWSDDPLFTGRKVRQYRYTHPLPPHRLEAQRHHFADLDAPARGTEKLTEKLERAVARLHDSGYQVAVVVMPQRSGAPERLSARETMGQALAAFERMGIPALRPDAANFEGDDFRDFGHLLASGRAKLTETVGDWLHELLTQ